MGIVRHIFSGQENKYYVQTPRVIKLFGTFDECFGVVDYLE